GYRLLVDGKPFIILGGQVNNPSAFPDRMRRAWPEFKALHANTIEFPVYWDSIEAYKSPSAFGGNPLLVSPDRLVEQGILGHQAFRGTAVQIEPLSATGFFRLRWS
ncbi:MAG TPA: hypothetical protein VKF63_10710, partial [Terracidiphilus sp.]|nr:hypothetical protein [Terracidiphilus sp.]